MDHVVDGVICLNTPFVAALRRNAARLFWSAGLLTVIALYLGGVLVVTPPLNDWYYSHPGFWNKVLWAIPYTLVMTVVYPAFLFLLVCVWWAKDTLFEWTSAQRKVLIDRLQLPVNESVPILCVRNAGDEVMNLFGILDGVGNLPYLLLSTVVLAGSLVVVLLLEIFAGVPRMLDREVSDMVLWSGLFNGWLSVASFVFSAVVYVLAGVAAVTVAAALLNALLRFLPGGIGLDNFTNSVFVRLTFTLVPLSTTLAEFADFEIKGGGLLSHSALYNDPGVHERIVKWMRRLGAWSADPQDCLPLR